MKKDNRGSAFILVIVALGLITIFTSTIFMQINNQIKNNHDLVSDVKAKYAAEAGINSAISKLIEEIESKVNSYSQSSGNLLNVFDESYIYLEVPSYTYLFEENYGYTVDGVDRTPIKILYSNNKVENIQDVVLDVVSKGYSKGNTHTIKSKIIFRTKKLLNGSFETGYDINTYDKIKTIVGA